MTEQAAKALAATLVEELRAQHSPLMSPLVWDLAHVGHYEELWLIRNVTGAAPACECYDDIFANASRPQYSQTDAPVGQKEWNTTDRKQIGADVKQRASQPPGKQRTPLRLLCLD